MSDVKRWSEVIRFARLFYESTEFAEGERLYKLRVAGNVSTARQALLRGDKGWAEALKAAFRHKENNLLSWQVVDSFLKWINADPEVAAAELAKLWTLENDLEDVIRDFLAAIPSDVLKGPSALLSVASFLLMGTDAKNYPIYRTQPIDQIRKLVSWERPDAADAAALYVDSVAMFDSFIAAARSNGLDLTDRLDAQGVLYCVVKWDAAADWSQDDKAAFAQLRGDDVSGQNQRMNLSAAVEAWDRGSEAAKIDAAIAERTEFVEHFPASLWPNVSLDQYALGVERPEHGFSWWLEFGSTNCGSISGGSAKKHLIFQRKNPRSWYHESKHESEVVAWDSIRAGFETLVALASAGEWDEIDQIESLYGAPVARGKTCWMYFPDQLLPIYSNDHLDFWLRIFGVDVGNAGVVGKNRRLFEELTGLVEFEGWPPLDIMFFLYSWATPNPSHAIFKIAPGEGASLWSECLHDENIRVGWDELGDLTLYDDVDAMRASFVSEWPDTYKSSVTRSCSGLQSFANLDAGDIVVANRGKSKVLGIGRVTTGYRFRPELDSHQHTVSVNWFDTTERSVGFGSAWIPTIVKVTTAQYQAILQEPTSVPTQTETPLPPVPAVHLEIEKLVARTGQVILYGPPGTGKTYNARRHAVWLLGGGSNSSEAATAFGPSRQFGILEDEYSSVTARQAETSVPQLTRVTFHPTYAYEDFIEGYKPTESGAGGLELEMRDGLFKRVCRAAAADPDRPYVIIIDEINRGNVPKIFGELITLIEVDKRGVSVTLPQSGESFSVPPNVRLIATMNTADRSIHVLDAALRRRFAFVELLPDPTLLAGSQVGTLPLDEFLHELNVRIRDRIGREKQVGHSVLMNGEMPMSKASDFALAFKYELLPLLQEYAYGDYNDLESLVGSEIIDVENQVPRATVIDDPEQLVAALATHLEISLA